MEEEGGRWCGLSGLYTLHTIGPLSRHMKFAARFSAILNILQDSTSFLSGIDIIAHFTICYFDRHCTAIGRTHLHLALM